MATGKGIPLLETYNFTETELMNVQILSEPFLRFCKTQLAVESMRARNLVPNPESYSKFIQEKAHIDGAISVWEFLINNHVDTVARLNTGE